MKPVQLIIFLDLNNCIGKFVPLGNRTDSEPYAWWPESITNLNQLTDAYDAQIVVTSTLRRGKSVNQIRKLLRAAGVTGYIADVTPQLKGATRGDEILAWLSTHAEPPHIVFDDRDDIALRTFIKVVGGITEADLQKARAYFDVQTVADRI